ncbi:hypothetical protein [Nodosilinea sp. P-1105]|uniref:hypothetical protein n=1 Tax=Nodosilinea sp. P-1105 TaxID=2546229 RepID=UPI00146C515C|nr:hypothetical protein [Nodosilinea sp. P-1105]NMF83404.1 hypothetical protein [Nodosilinea sp. P-1105]
MITKEQIAETLRQDTDLTQGSDYNISQSNRSTVCTQRALDVLINKFGEEALKEVEGPDIFTRVQCDY